MLRPIDIVEMNREMDVQTMTISKDKAFVKFLQKRKDIDICIMMCNRSDHVELKKCVYCHRMNGLECNRSMQNGGNKCHDCEYLHVSYP